MGSWIGRMPTRHLNDYCIQPTEYRRWRDAHARFARRPRDRELVEELMDSIPGQGLKEPIILGVDDRFHDLYVADGHHRAVALMNLGASAREFPFRWYWIKAFGVHMERDPFPWHLLESQVKRR